MSRRRADPPHDTALDSAASPWVGLRSTFLEARGPAEQVRVFDLTARTAQALHRWAARFPLMRRVRVWPLALSIAAAAPFSTVDALITVARQGLWVFALDDLFDEEHVTPRELLRRAERYQAIARDERAPAEQDSLAVALREVREDLAGYPLFPQIETRWINAFCAGVDAMTREYHWREERRSGRAEPAYPMPDYESYLVTGICSINAQPHSWATVTTIGDASAADHLEHLAAMAETASVCIRLANDLQTYPKEQAEGKINALVLLSQSLQAQGLSEAEAYRQAESRVRREIALGLKTLAALQARTRTRTGRPEAAVADIARFACDFYTSHDYHTFVAHRG